MKSLLTLLLAALPALPYTITFDPNIPAFHETIPVSINGTVRSMYAGQIGVRFDNNAAALLFCADPNSFLALGPTEVTPVPDSSYSYGGRLAWLLNTYVPGITSNAEAAGLQLAVWELIVDGSSGNLTTGNFQTTSGTGFIETSVANALLADSVGHTATGVTFWVPTAGPSTSQTLFGNTPFIFSVPPPTQVDEPVNALLMSAGLLLVGALRYRQ